MSEDPYDVKMDQVNALYEIADALRRMAEAMERAHPPGQPNVDLGPLTYDPTATTKP